MKLAILYQQSEPPAKDGIKELVKIKEDCVAASQAFKNKRACTHRLPRG